MDSLRRLAEESDAFVLSDEMYDHLVVDGTMVRPVVESGVPEVTQEPGAAATPALSSGG